MKQKINSLHVNTRIGGWTPDFESLRFRLGRANALFCASLISGPNLQARAFEPEPSNRAQARSIFTSQKQRVISIEKNVTDAKREKYFRKLHLISVLESL